MGAFHEGHLELMRRARDLASSVFVSLFVNPTQFGPGEDFEQYPRDESRDIELAATVGTDVVWAPPVEEVYTSSVERLSAGPEAALWEGEHRPGHFDGVATVVKRLFDVAEPDVAVFGLKDLQQCAVIRAMVARSSIPVLLEFVETVREPSGLAMSSRNAYFSTEQRAEAAYLFQTLTVCAQALRRAPELWGETLRSAVRLLDERSFGVEYLACVDPATMRESEEAHRPLRLITAAKFHGVRLIDNVPV